jgi:hypothetical protein
MHHLHGFSLGMKGQVPHVLNQRLNYFRIHTVAFSIQQAEESFHQQAGLKCEEDTSKVLHL